MKSRIWQPVLAFIFVFGQIPMAGAIDLDGIDRDGVVFGTSMGHGWNTVHVSDMNGMARNPNHMSTVIGAVKLGWAWNDELVGFVGVSGWSRSLFQRITPASATNLNGLVELYYYPRGGGLWIKGGLGAGSLDYYMNPALPEDRVVFKESGFAFTLGTGFEVRFSERYGVGISFDYTRLDISDFDNFVGASTGNQVVAVNLFVYGS